MLTQNIQVLGKRNPKDKLNNINLTRSVRLNDLTQEEMAKLYRRGQTNSLNDGFDFDYLFKGNTYKVSLDVGAITYDSKTQAVVFDCGYSTVYNRYYRVLLTKADGVYSWNERITAPAWVAEDNIKTINGESLVGTGDIEIKGGGDATPTGTTLYFTTTDGQTLNANIQAKNSAGTVIEPSLKTPTAWYYDEIVASMAFPSQTTNCNLYSLNGVNIPVETNNAAFRYIMENCRYADLRKFFTDKSVTFEQLFYNTEKLEWVDVSNFNTSKVGSMSQTFMSCGLTSLNLLNWDTSKVYNMRGMFSFSDKLVSLDLSHFNTSKVTNMKEMFYRCYSLSSLNVSSFDTSNVTDMSGMFEGCKLVSLDLSHFNTSKVTNMKSMFSSCPLTASFDITSFNTSKVTNMNDMFSVCYFASLDLSHFNTSNVTDMGYMFAECRKLISLDLSNWVLTNVTNMERMFNDCYALKTITMKNCSQDAIDKIKSALTEAGILSNVQIITE